MMQDKGFPSLILWLQNLTHCHHNHVTGTQKVIILSVLSALCSFLESRPQTGKMALTKYTNSQVTIIWPRWWPSFLVRVLWGPAPSLFSDQYTILSFIPFVCMWHDLCYVPILYLRGSAQDPNLELPVLQHTKLRQNSILCDYKCITLRPTSHIPRAHFEAWPIV